MEELHKIVSILQDYGFDFNLENTLAPYNPLEYFVEQVSTKEIRHSQVLADLLNPDGPHQYKDLFLSSFLNLKKINIEIPGDCQVEVKREEKISRVLTEGCDRSIDILLSWESPEKIQHAIIIENKLNGAGFQPLQLEDYQKSLKDEGYIIERTVVIYDKKQTYGNGIISLCSSDISDWLNGTLKSCDKDNPSYCGIKAYAQLIYNMSIKNINMINAESIVEMARNQPESYLKLSQIVKAYGEIRSAVFSELQNSPELKGIKSGIDKSSLNFWKDDDYDKNKLFIVIEFYDDTYWLYIKNDNSEKDCSDSLAQEPINFEKWDDSKEWYVSKEKSERQYLFPKGTKDLITKIKKLIDALATID